MISNAWDWLWTTGSGVLGVIYIIIGVVLTIGLAFMVVIGHDDMKTDLKANNADGAKESARLLLGMVFGGPPAIVIWPISLSIALIATAIWGVLYFPYTWSRVALTGK